MPAGDLIDISVSYYGGLALMINAGVKTLYVIGKSFSLFLADIGFITGGNYNWDKYTGDVKDHLALLNSFASKTDCNNMLIYGCSRLYPFMYNGVCQENCSWFVFYEDGLERCRDQQCNFYINLTLPYPRNWRICFDCEKVKLAVSGELHCKRKCKISEITFEMENDEYLCV